jgi:hypothetical protein
MKLQDWAVRDALERGDWLTAVNAVAEMFNLERFDAASPAILDVTIYKSRYGQVRIARAGRVYVWRPDKAYSIKVKHYDTWVSAWSNVP